MFARLASRSSAAAASPAARRAFARSAARPAVFHNASEDVFNTHVLGGKDKLVLVDFYADWCRPCKMLQPILTKVANKEDLNIDLVTVDTEALDAIAQKYQITSLPTVFAFKNGAVVDKFIGMKNEKDVVAFVTKSQQ